MLGDVVVDLDGTRDRLAVAGDRDSCLDVRGLAELTDALRPLDWLLARVRLCGMTGIAKGARGFGAAGTRPPSVLGAVAITRSTDCSALIFY